MYMYNINYLVDGLPEVSLRTLPGRDYDSDSKNLWPNFTKDY